MATDLSFGRACIARAVAGKSGLPGAYEYALQRWGAEALVVKVLARAVTTGEIGDLDRAALAGGMMVALRSESVLERLNTVAPLKRVGFGVPFLRGGAGEMRETDEGTVKFFGDPDLSIERVERRKIAGGTVVTAEVIRQVGEVVESDLERLLRVGYALAEGRLLLDPTVAGSLTHGGPFVAAGGLDAEAIITAAREALSAFTGNLGFAVWICSSELAVSMALVAEGGAMENVSSVGGTFAGLPLIGSAACPPNLLALVDTSQIALAAEPFESHSSDQATIETGDGTLLELWQQNLVGLMAERYLGWWAAAGAVVVIQFPAESEVRAAKASRRA